MKPVIIVGTCIRWFILLLLFAVYLYALFLGTGNVSNGGSCFFDSQCKENTNLKCENFRCLCNKTASWINQKCIIMKNKSSNDLRASFKKQYKSIVFRTDVEFRNFVAVHYNDESYYYVSDHKKSRVLVYSSNWTYTKSFLTEEPDLSFINVVNGALCLSHESVIQIRSLNESLIHSIEANNEYFGASSFNKQINKLYVLAEPGIFSNKETFYIKINYQDNEVIRHEPLSNCANNSIGDINSDYSITIQNGDLYLGTDSAILVFTLSVCYKLLETNCKVTSIVFDDYGYMAYSCKNDASIYLYYSNGTSLNQSITLAKASKWTYLGFDLNENLIIVTANDIYKLI